ncbi:MAG: YicC family protein [Oligoflexia bacterium]|nr:YicC family protein [Oligoflexia bacterium]
MAAKLNRTRYRGPVSMTGFGAGKASANNVTVEVELKTVNGRFFDFVARLPRIYNAFEQEMRELLATSIERGRVEFSVSRTVAADGRARVVCDQALVRSYLAAYRSGLSVVPAASRPSESECLRDILSRAEVIHQEEEALELAQERKLLVRASEQALQQVLTMRASEGKRLVLDIEDRQGKIARLRGKIGQLVSGQSERTRLRLEERVSKLLATVQLDQSRLLTEVALLAERADVSEELVRIDSHLKQFSTEIKKPSVGRRLDFLLQEFGREFNTVGSKVQDAQIQSLVVEAKAELEKIREQVQNLE